MYFTFTVCRPIDTPVKRKLPFASVEVVIAFSTPSTETIAPFNSERVSFSITVPRMFCVTSCENRGIIENKNRIQMIKNFILYI